jgi:hypothetical protein
MAQQQNLPPQHQNQRPGHTAPMSPQPADHMEGYRPAGKLTGGQVLHPDGGEAAS